MRKLSTFKYLFVLVILLFSSVTGISQTTIAKWTFEGVTTTNTGSAPIISAGGSAVADAGTQPTGSAFSAFHASTSTAWSNPAGNGSAKSVSSNNWAVNDYYQFVVNTTGFTDISVVFDQTGSATGPRDFKLQYSINGTTFNDVSNYVVPNTSGSAISWSTSSPNATSTLSFNLTATTAINNLSAVYFRIVDISTVSINAGSVAAAGTGRVDNFTVKSGSAPVVVAPTVTTTTASSISTTTASSGGNVTVDGGASVTARGVVWNTATAPTISLSTKTSNGTGTGTYTSSITSLTANTKYFYRAYATNSAGTNYGSELNFTTLPNAPVIGTGTNPTQNSFTANWAVPTSGGSETFTYTVEVDDDISFASINVTQSGIASSNTSLVINGLSSSTTYYYRVKAVNATGSSAYSSTSAGIQTSAPSVPTITQSSSVTGFGNVCINTEAGPNSFTIDGNSLNGSNISVAALTGFSYSETAAGTYTTSLSFNAGNNFTNKAIYVKFTPTAIQSYDGNIIVGGGGASNISIPVSGSGSNPAPSVTNGNSSAVTATTATLTDTITVAGCSGITSYGFEYSLNSGFTNGMQVLSSNLSSGIFSATVTGLTPNQQYFYKAFATNSVGTTYGSQRSFINAPLPVVMASQDGLSYTEDFHDIANWSNFFITGIGANHFDGLSANTSGSIPDGIKITAPTNSFQTGTFLSSGGVQKGSDQSPALSSIVLLSTGSPDNTTSTAIDFYLDFTGVNAGTLSFDFQTLSNSLGTGANDRAGSLRVYGSTNGTTFTEITSASVLNFINKTPISGSKNNIPLPATFNNNPNARLRFYYSNGNGGTNGSRPKISIDNLTITAVPSTPCTTPTAQPTSMVFGTITDNSIQGSFSAASPASDQYLTVVSTNSSLTSNPVDGTTYNIGDAFGDGTVIAKGSSLNFSATGLSPATTYYFFTFAVNGVCTGGPKYFTDNPLINTSTTNSPLPSCTAPSAQGSNLIFGTAGVNSIQGSFTATTADEYLVLVSTSSSLTNTPVNGHIYNAGDAIGNATVVQRNAGTSFTANGLTAGTQYYFYIFSLNSQNCINGPTYNITAPLNGSQTTRPLPPCSTPSAQPTLLTFNAANTTISGTFNGTNSADDYLIIRSTSSTLSALPVDNTDYNVGTSLGGGIVIANNSATSFITNNLSPNTLYYFFVFATNKNCSGGTKYLTTSPLTGSATTTNFAQNNYYFGTLHSHSDYSDGNQDHPGFTPADDYNYAMTAQCMDFLGISEHNHFSSANNPGNIITNYHQGSIQANNFTATHSNFLALYGMEWGVISGGGHVVVYGDGMDKLFGWESGNGAWGPTDNYDVYVPKSVYTGPIGLFKTVNDFKDQNTFATLAHPNQADFNNLAGVAYDVVADSAIVGSAVESGPATTTNQTYSNPGSSMSYLWYYQTLLSKGYHLGPTIDHDNHNTTFGHTTYSRTAVIAPALTKTDLIKAMHDMHFYATQDCDSKVDFTINTRMMGSVFSDRNAPAISVTLSDATTNTSSAIIRVMYGRPGSGIMAAKIDSVIGNTLYFVDNNLAVGATGYYYIDISNGTSRIITSPIWYTRTCSVEGNATVYSCNSYDWNGQTYTVSGTYSKAGFTSVSGCDSTAILHLTITTPTTGDTTAVACDNFTWYGTNYTTTGTATKVLKERGGCDSTVTLHLTINHSSTTSDTQIACDNFTWHGTVYTTSGDYTYQSQNEEGCTNTATLHLTINHSSTTSETKIACDNFEWHGTVYTTSGDYTYQSLNEEGCTNTATLHLTINHSSTTSETKVACDNFEWHGTVYTTSGDYTYQSQNEEGCTNTATLHLTINHSSTTSETKVACDNFEWHGTVYTTSGDYTYQSQNEEGCTNTATLHLTINHSSTTSETKVACDNFEWHGTVYTTSGDYTYQSQNEEGCTNTATLHLTINHSSTTSETKIACDNFEWHGTVYTTSGDYTYQSQNEEGCTNTATLHLTINHSSTTSETKVACDNFEWHGTVYTTSGDYTYQSQNEEGCTNTATLHLIINHSSTTSETKVACDNFEWHGTVYTTSGDYTYQSQNEEGCTNTATLHLTINHSSSHTTTVTSCDSYTWSSQGGNGHTYSSSGTFTNVSTNAQGCPHTETLVLIINHSTSHTTTVTNCDSYTWSAPGGDGHTYTSSGTFTNVSTNAQGCPHTETLVLTINHSSSHTTTVTSCDSYTWSAPGGNGHTYSASGTFTNVSTNAQGCPHTETLNLTINHSSTSSETVTACGSYTWHGTVYTGSGNYIYLSTNAQGCTNTATLHLTINLKPSVTIPSVMVLPNGVNANTVYIGYTPASTLTVSANPAGGTPSYSYSWSAGSGLSIVSGTAGLQSVKIFANGSGNYSSTVTVTVSDSKGCTATATVTIYVLDVRSGNKNDKVTLCHNGNTLSVAASAVDAHLNHGDNLGLCTSIITSAGIVNSPTVSAKGISNGESNVYDLSNYPNPFNTSTIISYFVPIDSKVSLKIYNALGQAVTTLFEGDKKAGSYTVSFNASNLTNGFYYCKLVALANKQQFVRSIKLAVGK